MTYLPDDATPKVTCLENEHFRCYLEQLRTGIVVARYLLETIPEPQSQLF